MLYFTYEITLDILFNKSSIQSLYGDRTCPDQGNSLPMQEEYSSRENGSTTAPADELRKKHDSLPVTLATACLITFNNYIRKMKMLVSITTLRQQRRSTGASRYTSQNKINRRRSYETATELFDNTCCSGSLFTPYGKKSNHGRRGRIYSD